MNLVYNILTIYIIIAILYIIYLIFFYKDYNENDIDLYNKTKRNHTMIFIIYIIIGIIIYILSYNDEPPLVNRSANIISDVSDIYVK